MKSDKGIRLPEDMAMMCRLRTAVFSQIAVGHDNFPSTKGSSLTLDLEKGILTLGYRGGRPNVYRLPSHKSGVWCGSRATPLQPLVQNDKYCCDQGRLPHHEDMGLFITHTARAYLMWNGGDAYYRNLVFVTSAENRLHCRVNRDLSTRTIFFIVVCGQVFTLSVDLRYPVTRCHASNAIAPPKTTGRLFESKAADVPKPPSPAQRVKTWLMSCLCLCRK